MKVMLSIRDEQLSELDAFAAELGLSRSAAVVRAVEMARGAPTLADLRRLVAEGVNQVTQKRMGVQEVAVVGEELVKAADPEVEENRAAFLARRAINIAASRGLPPVATQRARPPTLGPGEQWVEPVDPNEL